MTRCVHSHSDNVPITLNIAKKIVTVSCRAQVIRKQLIAIRGHKLTRRNIIDAIQISHTFFVKEKLPLTFKNFQRLAFVKQGT